MRSQLYTQMLQQQFSAAFTGIRAAIVHPSEKGYMVEQLSRHLVERFTPYRFGIGAGFIIDNTDWISRQIDIVVYDKLSGIPFFPEGDISLFPIEMVAAVIEVKSTFTSDNLEKWITSYKEIRLRKNNKRFLSHDRSVPNNVKRRLAPRGYLICASKQNPKSKNKTISDKIMKIVAKHDTHLHGAPLLQSDLFIRQFARKSSKEDFLWAIHEDAAIAAFATSYMNDLISMPIYYTDLSAYFPAKTPAILRYRKR